MCLFYLRRYFARGNYLKFYRSNTSYKIVQQDDGLPQVVCVRCLGTLEFLCDFYDRCHHTQKVLSSNNENIKEATNVFHVENTESDKENALPALRKCYDSNDSKKPSNNQLDQSNFSSIENFNNFVAIKSSNLKKQKEVNNKKDCVDVSNSDKSLSIKEVTYLKTNVISSPNLKTGRNAPRGLCKKRNAMMAEISDSKITIYQRKESRKATLRETRNGSRQIHSPVMKKIERKNWFNRSLVDSTNIMKKRIKETKTTYSRVIPSHNNPSTTKTETPSFFNNVDSTKICNVINNHSIICQSKVEESSVTKLSVLSDVIHDIDTNKLDISNVDVEKKDSLSPKLNYDLGKSDMIVLKKEITEDVTPHAIQVLQSNQFVWIPNDTLLKEPCKPKFEKDGVLSNTSPPPGDEAGPDQQVDTNSTANHTSMSTSPNSSFIRKECFSEQIETKISKSSTEMIVSETINEQSTANQLPAEKELSNYNENNKVKVQKSKSKFKGNFHRQKGKDGGFGKISELISDEQKLEIEKYYRVDMSVVDSEAVLKNLTVIDKKNIQCNICGTLYPRMDKCQVHVWGHLEMRPYQCTACNFSTVTVSNVRCHIRKSHLKIKPFACHLCEKRYVTAVLLQEHLNTHTGARPFKCKICDFASSSRQVLSYHNTTHKPVKDIHCKVCGKEFYSRGRMRAHMFVHNKDKVVMCKLCSAYLSNTTALEQHMKNIHTRDYICNVCGKNLKSRKTLLNHKNVHAAAKYKCDLCPNVYKSSHILKEHLLKHEGIRKYKCNVCEKSFAQQSHLAAHMAVHSEVRYHCPGCNKAFNRQDNMKIHTKRCDLFLSNPELKNLLKTKGRARYVRKSNNPAPMDTHSNMEQSGEALNSKSVEETTLDETSISKDANERGYHSNQENISQCGHSESVQIDKSMKSLEKMIALPTASSNDVFDIMHENSSVIENVLSSDHF